jgi:hypothetical protein
MFTHVLVIEAPAFAGAVFVWQVKFPGILEEKGDVFYDKRNFPAGDRGAIQ